MKKLLLIVLVGLAITANAQPQTQSVSSKETISLVYKEYGYLEGVRLDSLPSRYLYVATIVGNIHIDYGQGASHREQRVLDKEGKKISFDGWVTDGHGALLNFLDYNGWEYVDNLIEPRSSYKYFVFKKKS